MRYLLTCVLLLNLLRIEAQEHSVSVDADPFFLYFGNAIYGESSAPAWQGPEGLVSGFDVARYRVDKDDWIRYRLSLAYRSTADRIAIPALDDDLQPIAMQTVEDLVRDVSLAFSLTVEWEKVRGVKKLKGLIGRGLGIGTSRDFNERKISNPLESYNGDTLWSETGYNALFNLYSYTGVQYNPIKDLSISARINGGVFVNYLPEKEIRIVREENAGSVLESMLSSGASTSWGLGFYFRPRIMLSFYF